MNCVELGDRLGESSSLAWMTGLMECLCIDVGKEKGSGETIESCIMPSPS